VVSSYVTIYNITNIVDLEVSENGVPQNDPVRGFNPSEKY
jgi:hypothetical protein